MISFNAIRNLPLLLPELDHMSDSECVEADMMGAQVVVSHRYVPIWGAVINVSINGSDAAREILVESFSTEFGIILGKHKDGNGTWHYQWPSELEAIPTTSIHKALGEERISQICRKHELSKDDENILLDLIVQFYLLRGKYDERTAYMREVTRHMSEGQRKNVIAAILEIMIEFTNKRWGDTDEPA